MARIIAAVTPFVSPIVPLSFFGGTASSIRAMPSARALLVASLLTEPPYGCLGPSGNDRYRKRSLRSQTVGLRKSTAKSRRLFRNESATSRRVRACSMNCILSQIAASTESQLAWKLGLGTSDRGWRDKSADCRRAFLVGRVGVTEHRVKSPAGAFAKMSEKTVALEPSLIPSFWGRL